MGRTDFPILLLSGDLLYKDVREIFRATDDYRDPIFIRFQIEDFFMSGLVLVALKFPSLSKFDEDLQNETGTSELGGLFQRNDVPSDQQI